MSQSQPQTNSIFRMSLKDWQAKFKAKQASQASQLAQPEQPTQDAQTAPAPEVTPTEAKPTPQASTPITLPNGKVRVKRLVAYKKRKQRQAAANAGK